MSERSAARFGFISLVALLGCSHLFARSDRVFLVPNGYKGPVVVLYGDIQGQSIFSKDGDGRRILKVGRDGILRLKESAPDVLVGPAGYFWEADKGGRIPIPRGRKLPRTDLQVFGEHYGVIPGPPMRLTAPGSDSLVTVQSTEFPGSISYEFFIIGVPAENDDRDARANVAFVRRAAGRE